MEGLLPRTGTAAGPAQPTVDSAQLAGVLAAFLETALQHADAYREAAGRAAVHPRDLHLAMMYTAVPGSPFWSDPRMPERAARAQRCIESGSSSESDGDDGEERLAYRIHVSAMCGPPGFAEWDHYRSEWTAEPPTELEQQAFQDSLHLADIRSVSCTVEKAVSKRGAPHDEAWSAAPAGASPLADAMAGCRAAFEAWEPHGPLLVAVRDAVRRADPDHCLQDGAPLGGGAAEGA